MRRRQSASPRATICNSISPPTMRSASAISTFPSRYAAVWEAQHVFDLVARNPAAGRRNNYSLASNPADGAHSCASMSASPRRRRGRTARRASAPATCSASSRATRVTAIGPFGDFHIKPTQKEMVYIGGGAGMAPLRATSLASLRNRARPAQGQFLVRRAVEAGDLLPGLLRRNRRPKTPTSTSIWRSLRPCRKTTGPVPAA